MNQDDVSNKISRKLVALLRDTVAHHSDEDTLVNTEVQSDVNFYESYGIDSLTGVAFVIEIQRAFKIRIPEDIAQQFRTIDDFTSYLLEIYQNHT